MFHGHGVNVIIMKESQHSRAITTGRASPIPQGLKHSVRIHEGWGIFEGCGGKGVGLALGL